MNIFLMEQPIDNQEMPLQTTIFHTYDDVIW